jgi:hypothetical protein
MTDRKTNMDVITEIMEYSPYGALSQMFVIDALLKQAKYVVMNKEQVIKEMEKGFIHGSSWVAMAEYLEATLEKHLTPGD